MTRKEIREIVSKIEIVCRVMRAVGPCKNDPKRWSLEPLDDKDAVVHLRIIALGRRRGIKGRGWAISFMSAARGKTLNEKSDQVMALAGKALTKLFKATKEK
jgi:hypothetical protein